MHSVANLATLQTPLAIFFPFKKAPKPYFVSENHRYCRTSARSCVTARTQLSLSLGASARFSAHTSLSLSLGASARFSAHTPLSPSLSVRQLGSARTHLSLPLSRCVSSVQRVAAEVQHSQSNKILCCFSNFTCKYS